MYTYSNDEGKSFSKPEFVDTLSKLVASATRGPQIASTKEWHRWWADASQWGEIQQRLANELMRYP